MTTEEVKKKLQQLDEEAKKEGWASLEQKQQFERAEKEWLHEPNN